MRARDVLFGFQLGDHTHQDVANYLETMGTQLVHGVLRGVPVRVIRTEVEVDQIQSADPGFEKRQVIVFNRCGGGGGTKQSSRARRRYPRPICGARLRIRLSYTISRSLSPVMSTLMRAFIRRFVPSAVHLAARWRLP